MKGKEKVRVLFVLRRAHIGGIKVETVSSVTAKSGQKAAEKWDLTANWGKKHAEKWDWT